MNEQYAVKNGKRLRRGYTTGSCAAAAAKAAAIMLLTHGTVDAVSVVTPKGIKLQLNVVDVRKGKNYVSCAVEKDGGDDHDATHGMRIYARVSTISSGISIDGGNGVGRVTRAGLKIPVGQAAINPVPRDMIRSALEEITSKTGYTGGLSAVISAPGGGEIALRTFNPKLGIQGGISILGTSGIVEPMSNQAVVDTIHTEIDSVRALGQDFIVICPGNYGRDFLLSHLKIDIEESVKCSNFIGETIDYAVYKGFKSILLVGHGGKLIKLAAGIFQTHSSIADGRCEIFSAHAALAGADRQAVRRLMGAVTTDESIGILKQSAIDGDVFSSIKERIENHIKSRIKRTGGHCEAEFVLFTEKHGEIMRSHGAQGIIEQIRRKKGENG